MVPPVSLALSSLHGASSEHNALQERVAALAHGRERQTSGGSRSEFWLTHQPFIPVPPVPPVSPVSPKPEVKFLIC